MTSELLRNRNNGLVLGAGDYHGGITESGETLHDLREIITHLFLPKKTPASAQGTENRLEANMLQLFCNSANCALKGIDLAMLETTQQMLEKWRITQKHIEHQNSVYVFQAKVKSLQDGCTLPIYIRNQNATLLITKRGRNYELASFRSSLPGKMVMSTVCSYSLEFPETREIIQRSDILISKEFAYLIRDLIQGTFDLSKQKRSVVGNPETRDVTNPKLVSDFIVGLLVPYPDSTVQKTQGQSKVLKKLRDQVTVTTTSNNTFLPFRRSGFLTSLKVAVQLKILENVEDDIDTGKLIYKLLMLYFLTDVTNLFCNKHVDSIDLDLSSQMLAKLGNRVRKLEQFAANVHLPEDIAELKNKCIKYTDTVTLTLYTKMQKFWSNIVSNNVIQNSNILPSNEALTRNANSIQQGESKINDLDHELLLLDEFIKLMNTTTISSGQPNESTYIVNLREAVAQTRVAKCATTKRVTKNSVLKRFTNADSMLSVKQDYLDPSDISDRVWMIDTENFIKFQCSEEESAEVVYDTLQKYISTATEKYMDNPVVMSQVVLISLKGLQLLDKMATQLYPTLLDYKMGVKTEMFDKILLPYEKDMQLLNETCNYFKDRDQKASKNESYLFDLHGQSLSVVFPKQNDTMRALREKILEDTNTQIQKMYEDIENCRKTCRRIQSKILASYSYKCKCVFVQRGNNIQKRRKTCDKCELKCKQKSVKAFRRLLPDDETLHWALIFELALPKPIAVWRAFLAYLKQEVLGNISLRKSSKSRPFAFCKSLQQYKTTFATNLKFEVTADCISRPYQKLNVFTSSNEAYILPNTTVWELSYKNIAFFEQNILSACVFKLESTENCNPYLSLQSTIESADHTQNNVMAMQNQCHENLSTNEFISFGSVRSGHRIQLRNLYEVIYSGKLSLDTEPVMALILQTIWQVGPTNAENEREAYLDFRNIKFCREFLKMLDAKVQATATHYGKSFVVLVAVLITRRIAEFNIDMWQEVYIFLQNCRRLLHSWINKIINDIDGLQCDSNFSNNELALTKNLLDVLLCSLISFSVVDKASLGQVFKQEKDIVHWMRTIYEHNLRIQKKDLNFSGFYKTLLSFGKALHLVMKLEDLSELWNGVEKAGTATISNSSVIILEDAENDVNLSGKSCHQISFDFRQGTFLVNGHVESQLPENILNNKLFLELFKSGHFVRVRQEHENVYKTVKTFQGNNYEFHQTKVEWLLDKNYPYIPWYCTEQYKTERNYRHGSRDDLGVLYDQEKFTDRPDWERSVQDCSLVITEIGEGQRHVLIHPSLFRGRLSACFIENYTHWLNVADQKVVFRPKHGTKSDLGSTSHYVLQKLEYDGKSVWRLFDTQNKQYILSIDSNGFREICDSLAPLEMAGYVNVTQNLLNERTAFLRRQNLKFQVKDSGYHEAVEYPGFTISNNRQCMETLVGLEHYLLLENKTRKLVLVPHSELLIEKDANTIKPHAHQKVCITLERLRQPPCFVYEFDDVLQQLTAPNSKSAWLYLAALHASTSSPLPDPFTGLTGTEMAVNILQSAKVWSCSPYDRHSFAILEYIKKLAPTRQPSHHKPCTQIDMEIITWRQGFYSMAAYDGFPIIVDKIIMDSKNLAMLHEHVHPLDNEIPSETSSEKLRIRAYMRYMPLYNASAWAEYPQYFTPSHQKLFANNSEKRQRIVVRISFGKMSIPNLLQVARFQYSFDNVGLLKKDNLVSFLLKSAFLSAPRPEICLDKSGTLEELLNMNVQTSWLKLYNMAISCTTQENINAFSISLCIAAYIGEPLEQLANLHLISKHPLEFPKLLRLNHLFQEYVEPAANDYVESEITEILKQSSPPFNGIEPDLESCNHDEVLLAERQLDYQAKKDEYDNQVNSVCKDLGSKLKNMIWPNQMVEKGEDVCRDLESKKISGVLAITKINNLLQKWYRNRTLKLFISTVQCKLNTLIDQNSIAQEPQTTVEIKMRQIIIKSRLEKSKANLIELPDIVPEFWHGWKDKAQHVFTSGKLEIGKLHSKTNFLQLKSVVSQEIKKFIDDLQQMMYQSDTFKILSQVGLTPRLEPKTILKTLLNSTITNDENLSEQTKSNQQTIKIYTGALAVLYSQLKQINRCIKAKAQGQSAVSREIQNSGHENWSPSKNLEWLLLELELNIFIRPIQVQVAEQMLHMPDNGNGVTQLNMGEGKTSVIIPMLCTKIAKPKEQLCRVTVLSSMFNMNLTGLTFALGGLLNKRLYTIPCRRDLPIDVECVQKVSKALQECLELKGVLLTLPEHRLSFRLLCYDKILNKEIILGLEILKIENWLREFSRDVFDESDELLSMKYQLVYTVDKQVKLDGGDLRWKACQHILGIVDGLRGTLLEKQGQNIWESGNEQLSQYEFPVIRLLDQAYLQDFLEMVADRILENEQIPVNDRPLVKAFIVKAELSKSQHMQIMGTVFKDTPNLLQKILLYSGYLKGGVLALALSKRWRVEYGIDSRFKYRQMAVPFRAKDVPTEKTEFGHPDLAILLTHLSYYYSGLSDNQLEETFEVLENKPDPNAIYTNWIKAVGKEGVPKMLTNYSSLNLKDTATKFTLFNLVRKHKMVVNFWLEHYVFPRECRQFTGKLVMTAWDLCYERYRFPVTGFSGTNDSKDLLPLMITQQDLPELQNSNKLVEQKLLHPENKNHKKLRMGVTCKEILEIMKQQHLTVLIDAGALMLELTNHQIAKLWLDVNPELEAIVYFSQNNTLLVKSRSNQEDGNPFNVSPYQERLDKCGVFLDDQHTRGTDFKFPLGSKACVTIGSKMKRDKLIQACMRMRNLGRGHSVTFYLSHEAQDKLGLQEDAEIRTKSVLHWVCQNTKEFNEDGLSYWALAGKNYAQRLAAEDHFHFPKYLTPHEADLTQLEYQAKANILANQCIDPEIILLKDLYGQFTQKEMLISIIPRWFSLAKQRLKDKEENPDREIPEEIRERFNEIQRKIFSRCLQLAPKKCYMASHLMEEEQEKQLELEKEEEVEEQRRVERPAKADGVIPKLHEHVKDVALNGTEINMECGGILPLCDIFKGTTFRSLIQHEGWPERVFATEDFVSVVIMDEMNNSVTTDAYLKPIQYVVACKSGDLLVISFFEANELIPYFQKGKTECTLHMFSQRKHEGQDLLLNVPGLQLPNIGNPVKILDNSKGLAALHLASGSLYFYTEEEQNAYLKITGLAPQPWSRKEKEANKRGLLTRNGFLLPQGRPESHVGFQNDPTELIKRILDCRHFATSHLSHVMQILEKKRKVRFLH